MALQCQSGRTDEQLEADERRNGIARQAEYERRAADAERHRLARLHGNPPEHLFDAQLGLDSADQVVGSDGDASGGDEDVCL